MMQEKRGMLKVWNMWLVFITFWLAILGTYLTRSGVISSVHAFAQSAIGGWFLWFLLITLAVFTTVFILNQSHLRSEHKLESMISRESSFLFNNLLLVVACITILVGTWFPLLYQFAAGSKVTVAGPYYNLVAVPVALLLLLLTAVGPLLAWRKTSLDSLKRNFLWPTCGALAVGVVMALAGIHFWTNTGYLFAWLAGMMATLVMLTVASEYIRGARVIARHTGQKLFASVIHLWHRNTRRYGGYIVHFGVAVVVIGILGTPLNQDKEKEMGYGDQMTLGPYTLVCRSYTQEENQNYGTEWAIMDVLRDGKLITTLYPERRFYISSQQPQTMPQIYPTWKQDFLMVRDLYLVYEGQNPDTRRPIIKAHLNPLVPWIWIGWLVMVLGTISCLIPNAQPVRVTVPARVEPVAVAVGD
jgi:cytochrome c-type biogenesis protein CcmF